MKALSLVAPGRFEWMSVEPPGELAEGHVRIRPRYVGICGTDLHAFRGDQPFFTYPRVLGHEISAVVSESREAGLESGQAIGVAPYLPCGVCNACRMGRTNACRKLVVLGVRQDGGLCPVLDLPRANLFRATTLDPVAMAVLEPFGVALHALHRGRVAASDRVLVVGQGLVGIAAALLATALGADVRVVDVNADRLRFSEIHGLTIHSPTVADWEPDVVVEASGGTGAVRAAVDAVAHCGRVVVVGIARERVDVPFETAMLKEIDLLWSRNAQGEIGEVIRLAESGRIALDGLVTRVVTASQLPAALEEWTATMPTGKLVVDMEVEPER